MLTEGKGMHRYLAPCEFDIQKILLADTDRLRNLVREGLAWFPHVWVGGATVSGQQIPS
jgi:hypothetical protein